MPHHGCQFDCFQNQLKPKVLGMPLRHFLNQIIWSQKTHHKSWPHLLVAALLEKDKEEGNFAPDCLPSVLLASLSTPVLVLNPLSSGFQPQTEDQQLSGNPPGPQPHWDCWDSRPCGLNNHHTLGFPSSATVGLCKPYLLCQLNKSPLNKYIHSIGFAPLKSPD